jgi:hypothetical protein
MVVNVNINMADVKGIKTQFHLRRTKILIKLKDRAILCVKSGEFMVFPTEHEDGECGRMSNRAIPDVEDKQENDA